MIEAQIRMRQQELQEDAERMKNKQTAASADAVPTAQVECCVTDGTTTPGAYNCRFSVCCFSSILLFVVVQLLTLLVLFIVASSAQGNGSDALLSQVQHSELLLRNSEAFKQMRSVLINFFMHF